jgi:hypothetical protein
MPHASQDAASPYVVVSSVMSGIITGPYFIQYFHRPLPHEVGTMVAVLEIGAFGVSLILA